MPTCLTTTCEARLAGVHPDLVTVVRRAAEIAAAPGGLPFRVTEGRRTLARQRELYRRGATRTMDSRHLYGLAVDLVAIVGGNVSWQVALYYTLRDQMMDAAKTLGTPLRWGGDWDGDGDSHDERFFDGPHFELPRAVYPNGADPTLGGRGDRAAVSAEAGATILLQPGSTGSAVRHLQMALDKRLPALAVTLDGRFGPQTFDAVKAAQRAAGLRPTGLVDAATAAALNLSAS